MLKLLACALPALAFTTAPQAQSKFTLKVHTGRGQIGYDVNSTLVIGEKDILLIDPQFSLSEGPAATHDMRAIEWMKKYIADWDANVAKSKTPAEMRANVLRQYPLLAMEFTLNDRIATYFPAPPPPASR
jgi:hypothetical protein